MKLERYLDIIYSPITLIDGENEYTDLSKVDPIVLAYLSHQVIGIRANDDNIVISVKKPSRLN